MLDHADHALNLETFVGNNLISRGYLNINQLNQRMSEEVAAAVIEKADRNYGPWERLHKPVDAVDLHQACFGLPGAIVATESPCDSCPVHASCHAMQKTVEQQLIDMHGSADPIKARDAAANRENVRRSRAKKKVEELSKNAKEELPELIFASSDACRDPSG